MVSVINFAKKVRNVLFIPSWLPGEGYKQVNGIFSLLQARALQNFSSCYSPILLDWGQGDEYLPLKEPLQIFRWLKGRKILENGFNIDADGLRRITLKPPLTWTHQLPFGGHAKLAKPIFKLLEEVQKSHNVSFDVIHAHVSYPGGFLASILSRELGLPFVLTEFMGPFPFPHFSASISRFRQFIAHPINAASANLVLSQYLYDQYKVLGLPAPEILPFSVDGDRFSPALPVVSEIVSPDRDEDKVATLVFVGSIVESKGIGDLLFAVKMLDDSAIRVRLVVVGDGHQATFFRDLSSKLLIDHLVEWRGMLPNHLLPFVLRQADIFVMPSWRDTFGVVYIEAMACGLPVIATRCGGPDSFVTDEVGLLVPIQSPRSLADAIKEMISRRSDFPVSRIRAYYEANFSDQVVVRRLERVYDAVLADK